MAIIRSIRTSLRAKLVTAFIAVGGAAVVTIGVASYRGAREALIERTGEFLQTQSEDAIDKIDRNLMERYGDAQAFAHNPLALGAPAEVNGLADFLVGAYGVYDLMLIVDLEGRVVGHNRVTWDGRSVDGGALRALSLGGEPFFQAIRSGLISKTSTFVGEPGRQPFVEDQEGPGTVSLVYAAPILDEGGRLARIWG